MATPPTLIISGKMMGKTRPIFTDWQLALPIDWAASQLPTLRDLLSVIVRAEVAAFQDRQESRRLSQILTADRIEQSLEHGKVTAGQSDLAQTVDVEQAIDNALQSFVDGFYCIFIDDEQQLELNDPVLLQPNSQLMFLRLMPLVGG